MIPIFSINISQWTPLNYDTEAAKAFFDQNTYNHPEMPERSHFAELRGFMTKISAKEAEMAVIARGMHAWHENNSFCPKCGHSTSKQTLDGNGVVLTVKPNIFQELIQL